MRILILLFTGLVLISSAYVVRADNDFYLKVVTGINYINPIKFENAEFKGKIKLSDKFSLITIGFGYKLDDSIRADLTFTNFFACSSDETATNHDDNIYKTYYKAQVHTLMLNAYKDIAIIGRVTPFIGGGIGVSSLKDKASGHAVSFDGSESFLLEPANSKKVHRFAYKLTLGVDVKLCDNVNAELSYNYFNLGRNKPKVIDGINNIIRRSYQVHNVTLGIRYNL